MSGEINNNFRCDEEFRDWLSVLVGRLDTDKSKYIREALTKYSAIVDFYPEIREMSVDKLRKNPEHVRKVLALHSTLIEICPDIRKIYVGRLRKNPEHVRKIFALLEEV